MDYERVKSEITEIASIAASVPEQFREKTFEVLLTNLLAESKTQQRDEGQQQDGVPEDSASDASGNGISGSAGNAIPMPSQVKVFMGRTGVTHDELATVVMYENEQVHFIREPRHTKVATGQIEWALLLAMKNAIESNKFEVDAESVRSVCQDRGYYDKGNFATSFKTKKNAALFKSPPEPQGDPQPLSPEGQEELGRLVKRLASDS